MSPRTRGPRPGDHGPAAWLRPPLGFIWMLALVGIAVTVGVFPIIRKLLQRLETLQRIKSVAPQVVVGVVSGSDDEALMLQCLQHGAAAFVPKHGDLDQFVQGISAMASGGMYFPRQLLWQVGGGFSGVGTPASTSPPAVRVTQRQSEVLGLLLKGFSNQVISTELGISLDTVKLHVSALLRAYKVSSRVHLILACANANANANGNASA